MIRPFFRHRMGTLLALLTLPASIALPMTRPVEAQTLYKSIPLDCGGWFSGFASHSSGRLYGFGDVFGFYRSDDAGQTWKYLQGDFIVDDNFVNAASVARGNADKVVFLTSGYLWLSTNGGTAWNIALSNLKHDRVRGATPVFFHPANDNEIWLASPRDGMAGTLWRSTNSGTSWSKVGGTVFDSVVATTVYIRPEFPDQIFVGAKGGLYASSNRGSTWRRIWNNGGLNNAYTKLPPVVSAIVRRSNGQGYVATDVGGYRITASSWAKPATYVLTKTVSWWDGWGPTNATVLSNGNFVTGGGGNGYGNPNDLQDAQRISSDGGATWSYLPLNFSTPPAPIWMTPPYPTKADGGRDFIVQDPSNLSRWFMTGGFGPSVSNDSGNNWKLVPNGGGLAGVMTYKTCFARNNAGIALIPSSDKGAFVVNDGGASGSAANCSNASIDKLFTTHEVMSSDNAQTLVIAGVDQNVNRTMIQRSTDGGTSWSELDLSGSGLPDNHEGVTRAVMAPGNSNDFLVLLGKTYAEGQPDNPGLWRTQDGGATFMKANGIPDGLNTGMRYHPGNAILITDGVGTNTRYLSVIANAIYRSTDGGSNWNTVSNPFGSDWVHDMAVDRTVAGKLWAAGGYRGLASSSDGGDTWTPFNTFTEAKRVDAANGRVVVWGQMSGDTWNKIYYSGNNGVTWQEKTAPNHRFAFLRDLAVDPWQAGKIWVNGISVNVINDNPF